MKSKNNFAEIREGQITSKNEKKLKDKRNGHNVKFENPAGIEINNNDEVTYITYFSNTKKGTTAVSVLKDKK